MNFLNYTTKVFLSAAALQVILISFIPPSAFAVSAETVNPSLAQLDASSSSKKILDFYKGFKQDLKDRAREEIELLSKEAREQSSKKNYAAAAELYSRIISKSPKNTDAMFSLGQIYLWQKKYSDARSWFQKVLEISPRHTDARLALAKTSYFAGDKKSAAKEYEEIYADRSSDSYAMNQYAQYLAWSSKLDRAAGIYEGVIASGKDTAEASLGLAKVLGRQKKYAAAIDLLKKVLDGGDCDSFEVRIELSRIYMFAERLRDSLKLCSELASENRDDERVRSLMKDLSAAFLSKGVKLYGEKKYAEAVRALKYTIAKFPSCRDAYKYLGLSYLAQSEHAEAVRRFSQYLRYEKNDADTAVKAAQCCVRLGLTKEAVAYYKMASNASKGAANFDYDIAKLMRAGGMTDEVRLAIGDMLKKDGASYKLRLLRAQINYSLLLMDEFENDAETIIEYRTKDEEAAGLFKKLADLYVKKGKKIAESKDYSGAEKFYAGTLLKTGPEYNLLMARAEARSRSGDHAGAVASCHEALELKPADYDARMYSALNLAWSKKYEEAIEEYKKVLIDHPGDSEALGGIARTYFWTGKYYPSLNYYRKAYSAAKKSLETITGYGNAMHIFSYDRQAVKKIDEALAKDKNYSYAVNLKDIIMDIHRSEFTPFRSRSKDSDRINFNGAGGNAETDIDLDTRLSASYRSYDIYMDGSTLKYKADTANLRIRKKISPLYKISGGVTLYDLSDPRGAASSNNAGYALGVSYDMPRRLNMALYFDRSVMFENPSAFRNKIAAYGPSFDLRRLIDNKYEIYFGAGYHKFSDSNTKKNFALKLKRIKKFGDFKIVAGPVYKHVRFAQKKYTGYYSPERYDSGGLEYDLSYTGNRHGLKLNEEYGRSRELNKGWKNYHKYELEAFWNFWKDLTLNAAYLKTNSGLDSTSEDTSGYWYKRFNISLNYAW